MIDPQEKPFVDEIAANPASDDARVIYADWLEERGDPRGGFLRAELSVAAVGIPSQAKDCVAFFNHTTDFVADPEWIEKVAMKFDLYLIEFNGREAAIADYLGKRGISAIKCRDALCRRTSDYSRHRPPQTEPLILLFASDLLTILQQYWELKEYLYGSFDFPSRSIPPPSTVRIVRTAS
jgi:uncharacterized protein (TIGR02996 family)